MPLTIDISRLILWALAVLNLDYGLGLATFTLAWDILVRSVAEMNSLYQLKPDSYPLI